MRRHRGTTVGFTLVELLVITGVGLLLLAIVLAVLPHERDSQRRRTRCLNQLKQIGISIRLYREDYLRFPTAGAPPNTRDSFALLTNGYQTSYGTWICRADIGVSPATPSGPFTPTNISYAYGGFGLTDKVQPDTPIACDRTSGILTSTTPWKGNKWTHRGDGGNVLYADGHVAFTRTMNPPMYHGKNP